MEILFPKNIRTLKGNCYVFVNELLLVPMICEYYSLSIYCSVIDEVSCYDKVCYVGLLIFQKNVSIFTIKVTVFYDIFNSIAPIQTFGCNMKRQDMSLCLETIGYQQKTKYYDNYRMVENERFSRNSMTVHNRW